MAVTQYGTPYVEGSDVVGQYPEVSHSLADHIDNKNNAQDSFAQQHRNEFDATAKWSIPAGATGALDFGATVCSAQVLAVNEGMALSVDNTINQGQIWYKHNGTWHKCITFEWATPGDNDVFIQSGREWNLNNPNNAFVGRFLGTVLPINRASRMLAAPEGDAPDGTFDMAETIVNLTQAVEALTARVEALESA